MSIKVIVKKMNPKSKLFQILQYPKGKLIACDLDGVLSDNEFWGDNEVYPNLERIKWLNNLFYKGAHIIIYTARNPKWYIETKLWLDKHGVMRHGIAMQEKIGADLYIDDKALNLDDISLEYSDEKN